MHRLDDSVRYVLDQKKSSRAGSLREAVGYALNRDKTEQDLFESAIGCTLETAFADMRRVKKMWHKEDEVQGFHLVQSFAPGESTPEQAHQIGLELAENLLDGRFQAVIATHLNTGHLHNHIVWNSVSIVDGKKYRSNAKSYITQVRRISDELCRKYHLSVIDTQNSEKAARPYVQWLAEQNGKPTWKTPIRQDVDTAVLVAFTWNQFVRELEKKGYSFCLQGKYFTLKPPRTGPSCPVQNPGGTLHSGGYSETHPGTQALLTGWEEKPPEKAPHQRKIPAQAHRPAGAVLLLSVQNGGAAEKARPFRLRCAGGYPQAG